MGSRHRHEITDMHPKSWLSKYSQTSISHLIKMALFYSAIGIILQIVGNYTVEYVIKDYEGPSIPYSIVIGLTAGPVEETLFFGIPFYFTGNHYLVLATGIIWSAIHLFNTSSFEFTNLPYGNFLFTIPHIFFSLRTWRSGKGWFAIIFHSAWNITFLTSFCSISENPCITIGTGQYFILDVISLISAGILLVVTYLLYQRHNKEKSNVI